MKEKEQCSGRVYDPSGWGRFHRCTKKGVVERDGKPYCKIHDPEYIKAKDVAKRARWDKEWAEEHIRLELRNTAVTACMELNPDNPLAVAESIKDMYGICRQLADWDAGKFGKVSNIKLIEISKQASELIAKAESK